SFLSMNGGRSHLPLAIANHHCSKAPRSPPKPTGAPQRSLPRPSPDADNATVGTPLAHAPFSQMTNMRRCVSACTRLGPTPRLRRRRTSRHQASRLASRRRSPAPRHPVLKQIWRDFHHSTLIIVKAGDSTREPLSLTLIKRRGTHV